jgi:hypothetical protein
MIFTGTFLKKKMGTAPSPVASPAPRLASSPDEIASIPERGFIFEFLFPFFERPVLFEPVPVTTSILTHAHPVD